MYKLIDECDGSEFEFSSIQEALDWLDTDYDQYLESSDDFHLTFDQFKANFSFWQETPLI